MRPYAITPDMRRTHYSPEMMEKVISEVTKFTLFDIPGGIEGCERFDEPIMTETDLRLRMRATDNGNIHSLTISPQGLVLRIYESEDALIANSPFVVSPRHMVQANEFVNRHWLARFALTHLDCKAFRTEAVVAMLRSIEWLCDEPVVEQA